MQLSKRYTLTYLFPIVFQLPIFFLHNRDYLFKCVDNSESVSADAYGQRHIGFPLRDNHGKAVAVIDISIGELKVLPGHENKEVQKMLRLLQKAHNEITRESEGDDKLQVLGK